MDKIINPLDGEMDLLGDTKSDIVRKLNPLTGRLEVVYKSDSYIQKINPFIGDFDMVGGTGAEYIIKEVTGNGYINLTNAVANHLMELKAYGGIEQRDLPSGYTQLDSITSTGSSAYILSTTDIANLTKAEIDVDINNAGSTTQWLFGKYVQNKACSIEYAGSNGKIVCDLRSSANRLSFNGTQTGRHLLELDVTNRTFTVDDTLIGTAGTSGEMAEGIYGLVGCFYTNFIGNSATYYGVKAWENDILVYDLVPCKNANDEVGMFNLVNGQFMGSDGEGTFTAGPNAVPTPEKPMNIVCNNGIIRYTRNMANVNEQTALVGCYISSAGVVTADSNNRIYQDYIPVLPNTTYTLSFDYSVYYVTISEYSTADDSGFIIRNAGVSGENTSLTITTSATTNYVRFGTNIDRAEVTIDRVLAINRQLEKGSEITPYRPYSPTGYCVDGATETIWAHGKNLFDSTTYKTGYYIDASGNEVDATQYQDEYLIRQAIVQPSTTYTVSVVGTISGYTQRIHAYDEDGNWISQITTLGPAVGETSTYTFTSPANCKYIRQGGRSQSNYQLEQGSTATTYEPYVGGTATAEMLLKVGDYVDEQEILSGDITRKIGIKVLDGTEDWTASGNLFYAGIATDALEDTHSCYCTHFKGVATNASASYDNEIKVGTNATQTVNWTRVQIYPVVGTYSNVTALKQWLTGQYNAGTPVIVVYPLKTPTTETVTGQTLNIQDGSNTISITQASIDNLGLYAKYKATA